MVKLKVTMKENEDGTVCHSKSHEKKADPLAFIAKDIYHINEHERETNVGNGDKPWNSNFFDTYAKSNKREKLNSLAKEDRKGIPSDLERDANLLNSDIEDSGKLGISQELECTVFVEQFAHDRDDEMGANLYNDRSITECELPEFEVCYKEVNCNNVIKDICVDEGMPMEDKVLTENVKDDCEPANEGVDMKMLIQDGLKSLSLENTQDDACDDCGTKNSNEKSLLPKAPNSGSESDKEDLKNFCESKDSAFDENGKDVLEEESFIDSKLPMQNFGTRSFLRSFLNALDSDANDNAQPPHQISSGDAISGSQTALSTNTEANKNIKAGTLKYDSKVDGGSITFNFSAPKSGTVKDGSTKNVNEQPVESHDESNLEALNSNNLLEASPDESTGTKLETNENVNKQSVHQLANIEEKNSKHVDDQAVETRDVIKDEGEASFSDAGLITFSGPIAFSGSLSIRSDASTASTRSFAFPILQSEWNSSPVRMAQPDGRHFRRRWSWRSGEWVYFDSVDYNMKSE